MHPLSRAPALTTLLAVALLALGLLALPKAATAAPASTLFGYGDQSTAMFADPLWKALPLAKVRRTVEWDTVGSAAKTAELDAWMSAAQAAGADPLLAIDRSWSPGKLKTKPTNAQYTKLINWLHHRYPWWNTLTPWNEANFRDQPTGKNPALAATWWRLARVACGGCTVTSPSIVAWSGAPKSWVKTFQKQTGGKVKLWAVHTYADNNRHTDANLKLLEKQLPGKLWVTEAAGWVKFLDGKKWPYSEARAAKAIKTIFATAKKHKSRVKRWYFYQWRGGSNGPKNAKARWDSGVLNADGTKRAGYIALRKGLTGK